MFQRRYDTVIFFSVMDFSILVRLTRKQIPLAMEATYTGSVG